MVEKKCIYCGDVFTVRNYREKTAFYCSRDCFKKNKGLVRGVFKTCLVCGKKFKAITGAAKYCSKECFKLVRTKQWRAKEYKIRFGIDRKIILEKFNYSCSKCGASLGTKLHIHHKDGNGRLSEKPNNSMDNFTVLCNSCHQKEDWKRRMLGKWSMFFDKCQRCGTTDIPHNARGYCKKCYKILFRH